MESVKWFFKPWGEGPGRNSTPGQAPLASLHNVDVFVVYLEPEGTSCFEGPVVDGSRIWWQQERAVFFGQARRNWVELHDEDMVRKHRKQHVGKQGHKPARGCIGLVQSVGWRKHQPVIAVTT